MAAPGYPENPKVNSDAISYITGGVVLFFWQNATSVWFYIHKVLKSRAFISVLSTSASMSCLSAFLWPYMCACDCRAVAHVAQSRPWCLLASCLPSDLCPEWIKPGLSALDDWSSFQHHNRHWHHTLSPGPRDSAPFLASECEPHLGVLATRQGSFHCAEGLNILNICVTSFLLLSSCARL